MDDDDLVVYADDWTVETRACMADRPLLHAEAEL